MMKREWTKCTVLLFVMLFACSCATTSQEEKGKEEKVKKEEKYKEEKKEVKKRGKSKGEGAKEEKC